MCKHLVSLVYKKKAGSVIRKAVLGYMADRASEDGDGIYTSKGRIARETEVSQSSVKRAINEFIAEGLLVEVGKRRHANGETTVYAIRKEAVEALPDAKDESVPDTTCSATGSTVNPVHGEPGPQGTPTRSTVNPHPVQGEPQTTLNHLEPPKEDHLAPMAQDDPSPSFADFWEAWPLRKIGRSKAEAAFKRLSAKNRQLAVERCRAWSEKWRAAYPGASDLHPTTFLNGKRWEDDFGQPAIRATPIRHHSAPATVIPSQMIRQEMPPPAKEFIQ